MYAYVIADVFTGTALEGNPLAVVPDATGLSPERMQRIAREMNLSETTFVLPPTAGGDVRVRIFTPVGELPFAGHPTFGTAAVLAATAHPAVRDGALRMETGMGMVPFHFPDEATTTHPRSIPVRMLQPIPVWEPYARAGELLDALGVRDSTLPVEVYRNGPRHAFVGLPSVVELSALRPDLRALAEHDDLAANCFAPTEDPLVWRARMFSPAYGVTEDAGTGSAAGPLALHLGRHGLVPIGATITVRQGVEMGRPSTIRASASMCGGAVERVEVSGSAVVVADGRLYV
ncbi:PhzF family phenazine biosynthesis protein [Dactylosporangium sp. CA-233914]|uniref:PhzF family phenazine biosynthesis protein n=1 Tax=Dactylosporangium sp. CA-233914 TaxID=3239934 RepID=UPI003D8A2E27